MRKNVNKVSMFVVIIIFIILLMGLFSQLPKKIGEPPKLQSFLFQKPNKIIPVEGKYIFKSATELASLIKGGEATSVDIVREYIAYIKNNNWKYNAIVWLREQEALKEAAFADEFVASGDTSKLLLGVPVTVKEQFMVRGLPSTLNAKRFGIIAGKDAAVVKQIKDEGAIILGTTNLSLMVSFNETFGEIYPTGNNPYDTSLTPGGSTGGGAAALAAGFTSLSLGGDAGGSVRIPAAFCGVYGMKPSFGLINVTEGVMPFEIMRGKKFGLACTGPIARNVEDLKLYWKVLVKTPIDKKYQKKIEVEKTSDKNLNQYKIAWIDEWKCNKGTMKVGNDIKEKLSYLIKTLKEKNVSVQKSAPDIYDDMVKLWGGILFQITTQDESWLVRKIIKFGVSKQDNGSGNFESIYGSLDDNSDERWKKLTTDQKYLSDKMEDFFKDYDFLILPITYGPAFIKTKNATELSDEDGKMMPYIDYFPYTAIFNATGNPAVVIPMGLNSNGLPVSLQVVGPLYSDEKLLCFLKEIEPLIQGFVKPYRIE